MPCVMAAVLAVLAVSRFDTSSDCEDMDQQPLQLWLKRTKRQ